MRASELKNKYPEYWNYIESSVIDDMRDCMPQSMVAMSKDPDLKKQCRINRVAHNAAFNATLRYHNLTKDQCVCLKVVNSIVAKRGELVQEYIKTFGLEKYKNYFQHASLIDHFESGVLSTSKACIKALKICEHRAKANPKIFNKDHPKEIDDNI